MTAGAGGRRRYAVVGLGSRARMYTSAILGEHRERAELVGFCDTSSVRMAWHNAQLAERFGAGPVRAYDPGGFEQMLADCGVETVIVTSVDRTHDRYIVAATRAGCEVITEKPLTIDASRCQAIVDAVKESGRRVTVAFNYRYAPRNSTVKRLLAGGAVGQVLSVHFEWLLDTSHGADYFRRWHRDKDNSGGLMVHKASHHFDLVNWWLGARPELVFGLGRLAFYGRENAESRGAGGLYERAHGSRAAERDPFALDLASDPTLRGLYLEAEKEDGYLRDRGVFSDGISIEDDMAVMVRYSTGSTLTYHLTAYSPWEGYRVAFNGTEGRLELEVVERSWVDPADRGLPEAGEEEVRIRLRPLWREPEEVGVEAPGMGGHGGADGLLLADLFGDSGEVDPLERASGHLDGVLAVLPGIGANASFATGRPVELASLVHL
ncbi:MAG: Gfo/Idh/MocA family oxidoreductase [Candidatus Dormibacteraeota bacterium]|nr:Gfo/Idh/MocA family oxidoreductase [Candidatus Dormibacteraeota bacterium]